METYIYKKKTAIKDMPTTQNELDTWFKKYICNSNDYCKSICNPSPIRCTHGDGIGWDIGIYCVDEPETEFETDLTLKQNLK